MSAIMNPLPGESGTATEVQLFNSPYAPRIENPTAHEQACLDGYWKAVFKHDGFVAEMQRETPGWLPAFALVI